MKGMTIQQFFKKFPDDETCLSHLFYVRFGDDYECPKCNKSAKWYRIKAERAYSCGNCGHHLHPSVGTLFAKSRTSLQLWFYAIYLFTTTRHGVSAKELQRQLGVTYKTAWRMGHEIRKHMEAVDGETPLSGHVEVDEPYVGGKAKGIRGRGAKNKTIVFGMMQRNGDVMTKVVPNVQAATLVSEIVENVDQGTTISSDELRSYGKLKLYGFKHHTVQHGAGEYVRGEVHVNGLEGYWSYLKRSIRSTHISVDPQYLANYSKEFEYRWNSRKNPQRMFPELISTFQDV